MHKKIMDKNYCMSSFLTLRYIEDINKEFDLKLNHKIQNLNIEDIVLINSVDDLDYAIQNIFDQLDMDNLGLMLSGGMDSAVLASYMKGCKAYTFKFDNNFHREELQRAEYYANKYNLDLRYIDISWEDVLAYTPIVMKNKQAPVHSIEPQIYKAAIRAKDEGISDMIIGDSADLNFGGMNLLLAKDWNREEFQTRFTFVEPTEVLKNPVDMSYVFDRYETHETYDFLLFLNEIFSLESFNSYINAFEAAELNFIDPYSGLRMAAPLDLKRIRSGESKYLIRDLFKKKYSFEPPNKIPMPRPVEAYFKNWGGPKREEFKADLDITKFDGNQKWLLYCLVTFSASPLHQAINLVNKK